ncbi:major facilitator superfamily domain-containing protein [Naematelia encephala]|uniref:Major facilitator superfamily domain-containing protein n=1 Tax=Naematelia encephala TaxID=71784 RepID=A0A1Y2AMJ0_9TREE|nr:major facilitator superfamily domain-containing protein [Naematelia encephala]
MLPDEVSRAKRFAQIAASIVFCFTIAGLVFGFAALKPILLDQGVYHHLCEPGQAVCKDQDTRLNMLFIVASSANNVAALPMGGFLDIAGPRVASIVGGILFGSGCITFSLGIVRPYIDTYLLGYILMALGAPAMFLSQFHLSNAFPARSGLILGAITGAFDASSLPLCFYKVGYFAAGGKPSVKTFFICYTIIPILLIIQQITFGPSETYARLNTSLPIDDETPVAARPALAALQNDSTFSRLSGRSMSRRMSSSFSRVAYDIPDDADDEEAKELLEAKVKDDGIVGVMFGKPVSEQVKSSWWWAMEFMILVHMTRINWYLTTVNTQLIYYTGAVDLADRLTDAFIFLLPLGGLLSIPLVGWLLDTRPTLDVVFVMAVLGLLFGILTLTPSTVPQLIGIGMLVVFRPLFYTAISDYAAKIFGFQTFGTVYGLAMTLSGLFGLILTPLDILTKGPLHGSFTPVNVTLLVLGVISSMTLAYKVWSFSQKRIKLVDQVIPPHPSGNSAILEEDEEVEEEERE